MVGNSQRVKGQEKRTILSRTAAFTANVVAVLVPPEVLLYALLMATWAEVRAAMTFKNLLIRAFNSHQSLFSQGVL